MIFGVIFGILLLGAVFAGWYVFSLQAYKKDSLQVMNSAHLAFLLTIFHVVATVSIAGIVVKNTSWYVLFMISAVILGAVVATFRKTFQQNLMSLNFALPKGRLLMIGIWLFVILQVFALGRGILAPPNVFDSQVYHLPISINWFQDGEIKLFDDVPVGRFNYATKAPKMLNYWFLAFSQGSIHFVELSQYFGLILLMLSVYGILRNMKASKQWAVWGALLAAFIPIVVIETHTLQDHMLLTAIHFAVVKLLLDFVDMKFKSDRWGIMMMSLGLGLLLAAKFSAPAHVVAIFGVFGLLYIKDIFRLLKVKNIPAMIGGVALIALVGGTWYILNVLNYGSIFGPPQPQSEKEAILLTNIMQVPKRFFESAHRYTPDLVNISGYGPFAVTVGLLGSLFAVVRYFKNRKVVGIVLSTVLLQVLYFSVYLTPYNYRLLIFMPVGLIIVGIYYISQSKTSFLQSSVKGLALLSMVFVLFTTLQTDYFRQPFRAWQNYFMSYAEDQTIVRLDYTTDKYRRDNSFLFIDQFVPRPEPILYITQHEYGYDDLVIAGYYDNDLQREAIWGGHISDSAYVTSNGEGTEELVAYMRNRNISYLHNNIVFFYNNPVELQPGEEFIELTENLFYLPDQL